MTGTPLVTNLTDLTLLQMLFLSVALPMAMRKMNGMEGDAGGSSPASDREILRQKAQNRKEGI